MAKAALNKKEMFETMPVPQALAAMAVPTIISQLITLIYNMVDAFFIGQTGNSFMVAAISLTLTLVIMLTSLSNLFGVGGGSLTARLMGVSQDEEARRVSAFSVYGAVAVALAYSLLIGVFMNERDRSRQILTRRLRTRTVNQRKSVVALFAQLQRVRKAVVHCADIGKAAACVANGKGVVFLSLEEEQPGVSLIGISRLFRFRVNVIENRIAVYRAVFQVICNLNGLVRVDIIIPS